MLLGEDSDDKFRKGFEASKIALDKEVDISRIGAGYSNPAMQEDWVNWVEYERSKINAW